MEVRKTWMRGLLTLMAAALVVGGLIASQVTAAPKPATKKSVKQLSSDVIHQPLYYRQSAPVFVADSSYNAGFVACPPGTAATGGGVAPELDDPTAYLNTELEASHPSNGAGLNAGTTGWSAGMEDEGFGGFTFRVYVICAEAQRDQSYVEGSATARGSGSGR